MLMFVSGCACSYNVIAFIQLRKAPCSDMRTVASSGQGIVLALMRHLNYFTTFNSCLKDVRTTNFGYADCDAACQLAAATLTRGMFSGIMGLLLPVAYVRVLVSVCRNFEACVSLWFN